MVAKKPFKQDSIKVKTYTLTDVTLQYAPDAVSASHRFTLPADAKDRIFEMELFVEPTQNKPGYLRFFLDFGLESGFVTFLEVAADATAPVRHHYANNKLTDFAGLPVSGNWEVTVRREDMGLVPRIEKLEFVVKSYQE